MKQIELPKPLTWEEIQQVDAYSTLFCCRKSGDRWRIVNAYGCDINMDVYAPSHNSTGFYINSKDAVVMSKLLASNELFLNTPAKSWELKEGGLTEDLESTVDTIRESIVTSEQYDSILLEAHSIVNGSRKADYKGTEGFEKISAVWNILYPNKPLTAYDVAMLMVILKTVRESVTPKRDNLVDACGYLHFVDLLRDGRSE